MISGDQTGYVKGQFIGQNIRIVEDIICYANRKQLDSIIALLDFCKAFDSIEWAFIYEVLAKFNVCHDYIKWIKILYSDPKITVKNNGWLTEYINVSKFIKQRCPVSALLLILCIEMLSRKISMNNSIKGIKPSSLVGTRDKSEIKTSNMLMIS